MLAVLAKKTGYSLLVLWGVVTVVFLLFQVLPGDPSRMMLDQREDSEQLARIKAKYGFDRPLGEQYLLYLNDLSPLSRHARDSNAFTHLSGYPEYRILLSTQSAHWVLKKPWLRLSFRQQGKPVGKIIAETLPNTAILAAAAMLLALSFGLFLGFLAARYAHSKLDRFISVLSTVGMSVPSFFSAILVAWLFGYLWSEFTGLSMTGSLYAVDDYGEGVYIQWKNLILPAFTLGIRPLGVIVQLTRSSLLEESRQDYVRTAQAKGLSFGRALREHALRNALNPVVTAATGWLASMLAGAVFVEYIFGWNGLGKQIVDALNQLDLPVVMGAVLTIALTFVILTILVDLIYAWLDPRIRT